MQGEDSLGCSSSHNRRVRRHQSTLKKLGSDDEEVMSGFVWKLFMWSRVKTTWGSVWPKTNNYAEILRSWCPFHFIYTDVAARAWELGLYPEAPKVLVLRIASCRPRSNSVCFGVFFVAALLAIGREDWRDGASLKVSWGKGKTFAEYTDQHIPDKRFYVEPVQFQGSHHWLTLAGLPTRYIGTPSIRNAILCGLLYSKLYYKMVPGY